MSQAVGSGQRGGPRLDAKLAAAPGAEVTERPTGRREEIADIVAADRMHHLGARHIVPRALSCGRERVVGEVEAVRGVRALEELSENVQTAAATDGGADHRITARPNGRARRRIDELATRLEHAPSDCAHRIAIPASVKPGSYTLFVEAAREDGGRELISLTLDIPTRTAAKASGKTELGAVALSPR